MERGGPRWENIVSSGPLAFVVDLAIACAIALTLVVFVFIAAGVGEW